MIPVKLSCNHNIDYPNPKPVTGDTVWCYLCGGYREVTLGRPNHSKTTIGGKKEGNGKRNRKK